jgi:hypothetical protein
LPKACPLRAAQGDSDLSTGNVNLMEFGISK